MAMTDFDAKLNRRHRQDWKGQQIEVEVTDESKRVMRIVISRTDGYQPEDPTRYTVHIVSVVDSDNVEVSLMDLDSGHTKVAQ